MRARVEGDDANGATGVAERSNRGVEDAAVETVGVREEHREGRFALHPGTAGGRGGNAVVLDLKDDAVPRGDADDAHGAEWRGRGKSVRRGIRHRPALWAGRRAVAAFS